MYEPQLCPTQNIFKDYRITNSKVASRVLKLKPPINALKDASGQNQNPTDWVESGHTTRNLSWCNQEAHR